MQQVSPGTAISCDSQMCAALRNAGFLASALHVLGPTSPPPLGASLVVETAAVRQQFGSSLDTEIAPAAIASIGSGPAEISIRMIAPHGVTAFRQALAAGMQTRKQNEAALLGGSRIATSGLGRTELASGSADMRLVLAITYLAATLPVDIVEFGTMAIGGSPELPLRFADLAETDQAAHMSSSAYVAAMLAALRTVPIQYRPLWAKAVRLSSGVTVLRIDVGAPSPLGLPASSPS